MTKIKFDLSLSGINKAIDEINDYKIELKRKCDLLIEKLADIGISAAQFACADDSLGKYIVFTKRAVLEQENTLLLVATNRNGEITRYWNSIDEFGNSIVKSADVSPLLMVEFGSGSRAENPKNIQGVGRGTFPGQVHAFESSWSWQTLDGRWHSTKGHKPSMPMVNAFDEMVSAISRVVTEVFGG